MTGGFRSGCWPAEASFALVKKILISFMADKVCKS